MEIIISIPDEFAAPLIPAGQEPSRAALEALALEAYRERRMTGYQLRTLLGISSRFELDVLLKEHKIEKYTIKDFEHDLATIEESDGGPKPERPA
jgi:hypothetical protein